MATDNVEKQRKRKEKNKKEKEYVEPADPAADDKKTKKKNKKRKHQQPEDEGEGLDHDNMPRAKQNKRNKRSVVTDERFASVHFDPRFQRVPKKEAKVAIDSRFARMLKDKSFDSSSAPVDKRGRPREEKAANRLLRYYHNEEEEREKEEEEEERDGGSETEASDDEGEGKESSSTNDDDDDDEFDFDDDEQDVIQSDVCQYLMPSHEDTPLTEQETYRLAVVNMDWDHIKAVDLYVAIISCLPKGGQVLSVGIYPSEFGLKCMEVEAVHGPSALIDNNEENSEDESESDDENLRNEKLRAYELNKLRYYYGVAVFDSSATANYVYKNLDGTELLRTSNVFDLRFIPDSMEFKHPPRDNTTEAPTRYSIPDFHTRALQQSKVNLTWEDDEPTRTKILRRKFNPDQLDELNEYLASSGDSDASDEDGESDGSERDAESFPNGKAKKHKEVEKLRALLLSGDGSGSDKDEDDQDMEITFNTGLEDLSKRILEKKDKKSETVWEQVLRKRSEKRKARKNRSKYSSDEDSSDSDAQEAPDQPDDFFMEEEQPLDSDTNVSNKKKNKDSSKSKRGKGSQKEREESPDEDKEQEASKAELELLFAEDQGQSAKGYKLKRKKGKGKKGKETSIEAKLPDVDPSEDPRFSALFTSHLYALDPTDPQFKRSAAYARQKLGKQRKVKGTAQAEETEDAPDQTRMANNEPAPSKKEKYELSSTVQSLKRNLGNLKKGSRGR